MSAPKRLLAIGAHPDDIEIGCGGTIARLIQEENYEAHFLLLTSGEAGRLDQAKDKLAALREEEAKKGATVIGASKVSFFRIPDAFTAITRDMKMNLIAHIRQVKPDLAFIHTPNDSTLDHRLAHELSLTALGGASGPWFHEAGGQAWDCGTILGFEVWTPIERPTLCVDISKTLDKKLSALRAHKSQIETIRYDAAFEGLARYRGAMSGRGEYAEVFEAHKVSSPLPHVFSNV